MPDPKETLDKINKFNEDTFSEWAEKDIPAQIGTAVIELLVKGADININSIAEHIEKQVLLCASISGSLSPGKDFRRMGLEAALRRLRGLKAD